MLKISRPKGPGAFTVVSPLKLEEVTFFGSGSSGLGLLINFNVPLIKDGIERVVLTKKIEP